MKPSADKNCQRYIDDPEYTWYGGYWRTAKGIENQRAIGRRRMLRKRREGTAWDQQPENLAVVRARNLRSYHKIGWKTERLRNLAAQKTKIIAQLEELRA